MMCLHSNRSPKTTSLYCKLPEALAIFVHPLSVPNRASYCQFPFISRWIKHGRKHFRIFYVYKAWITVIIVKFPILFLLKPFTSSCLPLKHQHWITKVFSVFFFPHIMIAMMPQTIPSRWAPVTTVSHNVCYTDTGLQMGCNWIQLHTEGDTGRLQGTEEGRFWWGWAEK